MCKIESGGLVAYYFSLTWSVGRKSDVKEAEPGSHSERRVYVVKMTLSKRTESIEYYCFIDNLFCGIIIFVDGETQTSHPRIRCIACREITNSRALEQNFSLYLNQPLASSRNLRLGTWNFCMIIVLPTFNRKLIIMCDSAFRVSQKSC